jgi:hypothetical protein
MRRGKGAVGCGGQSASLADLVSGVEATVSALPDLQRRAVARPIQRLGRGLCSAAALGSGRTARDGAHRSGQRPRVMAAAAEVRRDATRQRASAEPRRSPAETRSTPRNWRGRWAMRHFGDTFAVATARRTPHRLPAQGPAADEAGTRGHLPCRAGPFQPADPRRTDLVDQIGRRPPMPSLGKVWCHHSGRVGCAHPRVRRQVADRLTL